MKHNHRLLIALFVLSQSASSFADINHLATPAFYDNVGGSTNSDWGQTFRAVDTSVDGVRLYIGDPLQPGNPVFNALVGPAELILYDATVLSAPVEIRRTLVLTNGQSASGLTTFYFDTRVATTVGARYFVAINAADAYGIGIRSSISTYLDGGESFRSLPGGSISEGQRDLSFAVFSLAVGNVSIRLSQVELCWFAETNKWYQLQYASLLTTNQWVPLGTNWVQGGNAPYCANDAIPINEPQRFYRTVSTDSQP